PSRTNTALARGSESFIVMTERALNKVSMVCSYTTTLLVDLPSMEAHLINVKATCSGIATGFTWREVPPLVRSGSSKNIAWGGHGF
ncbi:MAG: hypothetical protein VYC16_03250, partial [Pseudomonadota bacterium]|nr:hypothetical protein [Pseudomonadota bacterium]